MLNSEAVATASNTMQSARRSLYQYPYTYPAFANLQQKSTVYTKKDTDVRDVKNVDFGTKVGAARRRLGAQGSAASLPALAHDTGVLGTYIARFSTGSEIWAVQNNSASSATAAVLQYWTGSAWTAIKSDMQKSTEVNIIDDPINQEDEIWVSSYDPATDTIYPSFTVDNTHNVSTTRQLFDAPDARFFMEFGGDMWAFDCMVDGVRYRNRAYQSSGPTGAITFSRAPQTDVSVSFDLVNQVPTMTSDSAPAGVASASSEATGFLAWKAFDNVFTGVDEWSTNGVTTGTLEYDFGSGNAKIITYYSLMAVSQGETGIGLGPKTWTFQGSNDNSTWTTLDTETTVPDWAVGELRTYSTTNTTSYRYYRLNVSANQGNTNLCVASFQLQSSATNTNLLQLQVDGARYLKPGQVIDIYAAGTDTLEYTITINDTDKANDVINFLPYTQGFTTSGVNTSTDVITVSDTSQLTTGTPIKFITSGGLPAGLVLGTTYYAVKISGTTFKVATSSLNATIGVTVDITTTGSGNHIVQLSYIVNNQDELWAHGRKNTLTRFWNTDYRTPETADWIKIPPTTDELDQITAVGQLTSRMYMFTKHSLTRWDGQQILQLRNDVGCIAYKSISYYDSYMVWLDAKGRVWARNEDAGTMDKISDAICDVLALVPQSQLEEATSVCIDGFYKLYLGQINGKSLRVVYNFLTNQWTIEWFVPQFLQQFEYTYEAEIHPHFWDEHGQLWVDEQGNDDNGVTIPFEMEIGNDIFGFDLQKEYYGITVYSSAATATKVQIQIDNGQWKDIGQLTSDVTALQFPGKTKGTTINVKFVDSSSKKPVEIDRATLWWNLAEDSFHGRK